MLWLFAALAAVIVFVIAAVVVGRETSRLNAAPPRPVFDEREALGWVTDRLPDDVSARLSFEDVRAVLLWGIEHLGATTADEIVVADAETHDHVVGRAKDAGLDVTPDDVQTVLDLEVAYLQVIGAAGPQAEL